MQGLFITGTNTGVGKTYIGCQLIKQLVKKHTIKVRKPVETDCTPTPKDALALSQATGNSEPLSLVCPYQYKSCASSAKAAQVAKTPLQLNQLVTACRANISDQDFLLVEGAGGFYSPLTNDALNVDLAVQLKLAIILIVKDELGCLSQTLLCLEAIQKRELTLAAVVLNQITVNDLDNLSALRHYSKAKIIAFPSDDFKNFINTL